MVGGVKHMTVWVLRDRGSNRLILSVLRWTDDSSDDEPLAETTKTSSAKKAAENQNQTIISRRSKEPAGKAV